MTTIKQLKTGGKVFFPQTIAEAVIVQNDQEINTLCEVLQKKIESIDASEELTITPEGTSISITHTNEISENTTPEPVMIQHDKKGHIIVTKPYGKLFVKVTDDEYRNYSGSEDTCINFGDDFQIQEDNIILKWNNI